MKNKQITLTLKTFIYFVIFAVIIVVSFWLLEVYFIDKMYAKSTKENCYEVAIKIDQIISEYDRKSLDLELSDIKGVIRDISLETKLLINLLLAI